MIETLNETMNACQSILQVILIDYFIIANNNKQTGNNFFQDVIHINIYFQRENLLPLLRQRLKSVHIS